MSKQISQSLNIKMKKSIILFILAFIGCAFYVNAQIYSFEDGIVPTIFITNGNLTVADKKFKLGNKSLCWECKAGSKLTLANITGLEEASKSNAGGVFLWQSFLYSIFQV